MTELAKQGKGFSFHIKASSTYFEVNRKIIKVLGYQTIPALTNLKTNWNVNANHVVPRKPLIETFYANETFLLTAIVNKSQVGKNSTLKMTIFNTL